MDSHLLQLLHLCVRMLHFIAGVAWIGASFYFNWLENALERQNQRQEIAGSLWAIHGGGFYYLEKYKLAPEAIPPTLHWFKWEAYTTWLSGFALLILVYYLQANTYMADPLKPAMSASQLILLGLATLTVGWFAYDLLCKSRLGHDNRVIGALGFVGSLAVAYGLSQVMSPRAMYMHIGAMLGTCMAANVFFVIIPSQKNLVAAAKAGQKPDAHRAKQALQRSRHNNYLTLPTLFVMISNHFPFTYGHPLSWLILAILGLAGVMIRHWFNLKGKGIYNIWLLPSALALLLAVGWMTAPQRVAAESKAVVSFEDVHNIVRQRCVSCHSAQPTDDVFIVPPLGFVLDTAEQIHNSRHLIYQRVVTTGDMPFGNKTGMTKLERTLIAEWYARGASAQ